MSPNTAFMPSLLPSTLENTDMTFRFTAGGEDQSSYLWQQVNDILRNSVARSYETSKSDVDHKKRSESHILVARGVLVDIDEYRKRFAQIDIEYYRKTMSPELFSAFVRHIGSIPGDSKIDIEKLIGNPED